MVGSVRVAYMAVSVTITKGLVIVSVAFEQSTEIMVYTIKERRAMA